MEEQTFPALSIRQPWADLIVDGIKDIENRVWPTQFRGRLLIHAARRVDWEGVERVYKMLGLASPADYQPVRGALIGSTEIVDCVTSHRSRFFQGPYGFVLRESRRLQRPVEWRGRLMIFQVPASALGRKRL